MQLQPLQTVTKSDLISVDWSLSSQECSSDRSRSRGKRRIDSPRHSPPRGRSPPFPRSTGVQNLDNFNAGLGKRERAPEGGSAVRSEPALDSQGREMPSPSGEMHRSRRSRDRSPGRRRHEGTRRSSRSRSRDRSPGRRRHEGTRRSSDEMEDDRTKASAAEKTCRTCGVEFESKNELHRHIRSDHQAAGRAAQVPRVLGGGVHGHVIAMHGRSRSRDRSPGRRRHEGTRRSSRSRSRGRNRHSVRTPGRERSHERRSVKPPHQSKQTYKKTVSQESIAMSRMLEVCNLGALCREVEENATKFGACNVSIAFRRLLLLPRGTGAEPPKGRSSALRKLEEQALAVIEDFGKSELAKLFHAMAKCRYRPDNENLILELNRQLSKVHDLLCARSLSTILWCSAKMGWEPGEEVIGHLERRMEKVMNDFKPLELANVLWSYATRAVRPEKRLLQLLEARIEQAAGEFNAQDLSVCLWSYATMHLKPGGGVLRSFEKRMEQVVPAAGGKAKEGGSLRKRGEGGTKEGSKDGITPRLGAGAECAKNTAGAGFNCLDFSCTLWAYARMGMQPGEGLLQVLEARLCEILAQSDTDLARAPEARAPEARAPEARAPEARAPEDRAPEARADLTVPDLMNTIWAFAAMERQPGKLLLQVLENRVEKCIEKCSPQHVCMLLWSYARMGGQPGAWLQFLIEGKLEELMPDLSTFHVSRILWAYGTMNILPNGKVLQALESQREVGDRCHVDRDEVVPYNGVCDIRATRLERSNMIRPMPIPGEHLSETTCSTPPQKLNNPSSPGFRAALPPPPRPPPSLQQDGMDEDGTGGASCVAGRTQEEGIQDQEQQEHQEQHADGEAIASPRDRGDVRKEADDDPWRGYSASAFGENSTSKSSKRAGDAAEPEPEPSKPLKRPKTAVQRGNLGLLRAAITAIPRPRADSSNRACPAPIGVSAECLDVSNLEGHETGERNPSRVLPRKSYLVVRDDIVRNKRICAMGSRDELAAFVMENVSDFDTLNTSTAFRHLLLPMKEGGAGAEKERERETERHWQRNGRCGGAARARKQDMEREKQREVDRCRQREADSDGCLDRDSPQKSIYTRALKMLEERAFQIIGDFEPKRLTCMIHAIAKTSYCPSNEKLIPALEGQMLRVVDRYMSLDVASTLWAYATLGRRPLERLLVALETRVVELRRESGEWSSSAVAQILWASAAFGRRPPEKVLEVLAMLVEQVAARAGCKELSMIIYGYAKMGVQPEDGTMRTLEARALELVADFRPRHLTNVMWAYATMERQMEKRLLEGIEKGYVVLPIEEIGPVDVSIGLWSYAKMGIWPQSQALTVLEDRLEAGLEKFNSQHMSNTLWAYSTMQTWPNVRLRGLIEDRMEVLAQDENPQGVIITLGSYAKSLRIPPPRMLAALTARLEDLVGACNARDVSDALWAYAMLGRKPEKQLLGSLERRLFEVASEFHHKDVSKALWGACVWCESEPDYLVRVARGLSVCYPAMQESMDEGSMRQLHQVFVTCWLEDGLHARMPREFVELEARLGPVCRKAYIDGPIQSSSSQTHVREALEQMGLVVEEEARCPRSGYSIDLLVREQPAQCGEKGGAECQGGGGGGGGRGARVWAVEFDGPWHFLEDQTPSPKAMMKRRQLQQLGYKIVNLPHWEWDELPHQSNQDGQISERERYLRRKLFEL